MKRFILSLTAGVAVPGAMLGLALLLDVGLGLESLASPFYWIVAWPIYLFSEAFPGKNPIYPDEVTRLAFVSSMLFDILVFFVLTYVALHWRGKIKSRLSGQRLS